MEGFDAAFNGRAKDVIERSGLKQFKVAEAMGVSKNRLSGLVQGRFRWRLEEVSKIVTVLQLEPDEAYLLLTGESFS